MSDLAKLLKTSRLSALPKPKSRSRGRSYPRQPIVETRANALARNEWGLKYPLPSKVKSRYISFNDLDNMEHMVDFETNASFHWKRLRFQETGLVPQYETPRENPLFFDAKKDTSRFITLSSLFNLNTNSDTANVNRVLDEVKGLRKEFEEWLLVKDPILLKNKRFNQNELIGPAVEFLSQHNSKKAVDTISKVRNHDRSMSKFHGNGGLSYALKGRLTNTPNGVAQTYVGPGRITNTGPTTRTVAFGGFTAEVSNSASNLQHSKAQSDGKTPRETVIPFVAENATFTSDGQTRIKTNVVVRQASLGSDSEFFKTQRKNLVDRRAAKGQHETVEDLLALIKRNER